MSAAEQYPVDFLGQTVHCESLSDAVALKTANDMISGDDPTPYKAETLNELAAVLDRYGRESAAQVIREWHFQRE